MTDCLALAPVIAASESSQINKAFFYVFDHATKDGLYNYQVICFNSWVFTWLMLSIVTMYLTAWDIEYCVPYNKL